MNPSTNRHVHQNTVDSVDAFGILAFFSGQTRDDAFVRKRHVAFAVAGLTAASFAALAHGGKQMPPPFMQRHALMGSLAAHMKAAKSALQSKEFDAVAGQADAIFWLARILPTAFPKGSGPEMGKTRASPKIWEDWKGFETASARLADSAAELKTAAKSDNASHTEDAFRKVGREGCGGCHKVYRSAKQ